MDCSECREALSRYIDGELGDKMRSSVEEHVASCPDCAAVLDEIRRVDTITHQTIELQQPQPDFRKRVLADLPPAGPSSRWHWPVALILFGLLAVVVAASIIVPILTRPRTAKEVVVLLPMEKREGMPERFEIPPDRPLDLTSDDPIGLEGPDIVLAFHGHIEISQATKNALNIRIFDNTVFWARAGHSTKAMIILPDDMEAGPLEQALVQTMTYMVTTATVHNLGSKPLKLGEIDIPPGFKHYGQILSESDPLDVAITAKPLARFFPEDVSIPLDWMPARPGRHPRRAGIPPGPALTARLIGEAPAGRPLTLVLTREGDTILVASDTSTTQPPFRFVETAWPLNELLAVLPGSEGRLCGVTNDSDLFTRLDGKNTAQDILEGIDSPSILWLPLQARLILHSPSGLVSMSASTALAYWREPRLKDCVGTLADGKGNVWSAHRDGSLTLLDGVTGKRKRAHGPIGQAFVSPPVQTTQGVFAFGREGRLLVVRPDGSNEMRDLDIGGGGHEGFAASADGVVYFHRAGSWYRAGEEPIELGRGGKEALLLTDGRVLAAGGKGLVLLPDGRTLVHEGPGGLMVGSESIVYVTSRGRVYLLRQSDR